MTRYRKNPSIAGRVIDGLAFIVTPDDNVLHELNRSATFLWQLAESGVSAEEAALALEKRYDVTLPVARADATDCLSDLVRRNILVEDA